MDYSTFKNEIKGLEMHVEAEGLCCKNDGAMVSSAL
jgi:hypothetical protein